MKFEIAILEWGEVVIETRRHEPFKKSPPIIKFRDSCASPKKKIVGCATKKCLIWYTI